MRGNIVQLLDSSQEVKAVVSYDPFGKERPEHSGFAPGWDTRLRYQGAPKDPKTGAYNIGPRIYDPDTNRFQGVDVFTVAGANFDLEIDPLTGNRYLYSGANPVGMFDDGHAYLACDYYPSCEGQERRYEHQSPYQYNQGSSSAKKSSGSKSASSSKNKSKKNEQNNHYSYCGANPNADYLIPCGVNTAAAPKPKPPKIVPNLKLSGFLNCGPITFGGTVLCSNRYPFPDQLGDHKDTFGNPGEMHATGSPWGGLRFCRTKVCRILMRAVAGGLVKSIIAAMSQGRSVEELPEGHH